VLVAPDDEPGTKRLRITSRFSGSTRWLSEWHGDAQAALVFAEAVADDEAEWVHVERRDYGPTEWD
jgi:hypothetical protein